MNNQFRYSVTGSDRFLFSDRLLIGSRGYGSHLPFLTFLIRTFQIQSVLEFGMGRHSTSLFIDAGLNLISLEDSPIFLKEAAKKEWFKKTESPNHKYILWPNADMDEFLCGNEDSFDLVFVDGSTAKSRLNSVVRAFNRADFIVIHDTEAIQPRAIEDVLKIPTNYKYVQYRNLVPETTVITRILEAVPIIEEFCKPVKCLL